MKKLTTLAALAALSLAFATPAFAADQAKDPMKGLMMSDHSMRTSKLIGMAVYNDSGDKIGSVFEVLLNNGSAPVAVINVGDYLGAKKLVAIPVANLNFEGAQPMMKGATKAMLQSLQAFPGDFGSG